MLYSDFDLASVEVLGDLDTVADHSSSLSGSDRGDECDYLAVLTVSY